MSSDLLDQKNNVDVAFSKQSSHFDEDDLRNPILQLWRRRIYAHVDQFLRPNSRILELNAGTGIDAQRFAQLGHRVHATDLSHGMVAKLREKSSTTKDRITVQHISFDQLNFVEGKFDYVFSNFGGLNCIDDLKKVTRHLDGLLNSGAYVTWVIMPRITPWEWTRMLRGDFRGAFRRLKKNGVMAHLEGEFFKTYYHSQREITGAFGPQFHVVKSDGLGVFSPPPGAERFVRRFKRTTDWLNQLDTVMSRNFPFNRWGDHVICTFQFHD